jgi:membrane protease YdiL (CAAX protease family)
VGALLQTWRLVPGLLLTEVLFFAAPAAVVLLLERRRSGDGARQTFRRPGAADAARAALLGALAAGLAVIAGVAVRRGLDLPLPGRPPDWQLVLALAVPAPLAEELLFRPVLQRALGLHWRASAAVPATALWFGLLHGSLVRLPETFLLGLFSGVVFLRRGNYWLSALAHAVANLVGLALWVPAARAPELFHPVIGLGLLVPVFLVLTGWDSSPTPVRSWRVQLRRALFGENQPPPRAGGRLVLPGAYWAGTVLMAALVAVVTRAELQAARAARLARAGGPEVRQRDEWVLGTNAVFTVRSRIELARWPESRESWVLALAYPEATLLGVELAGEVFDTRPVGRGTFELVWPKPLPPPGTLEVYWEVPLAALEAPERGFRVRLQALVPVHAYALRLVLEPGCGYVFERAPERPSDTIFSTSGQRPPRRDFGTCGLGLRRLTPETAPP